MQHGKHILVVEDEVDLAEVIGFNLQREGYTFEHAANGNDALAAIERRRPDLLVLDRMLPRTTGDDVIVALKRDPQAARIPVIMLTAKADESDELVGFALGADDYITKPFSMKRLLARVGALLRRTDDAESDTDVLSIGPLVLDQERHDVSVDGRPLQLTPTEFRLLHALMKADGRLLTRAQLIDAALGPDVAVVDRTIDVHVAALRKKLGEAAGWIQTIRGAGYTFRSPSDSHE